MGFTDPSFAIDNVQSLADQPTETAAEVKQTFDQAAADIKTFIEAHIDELEATTDGNSGMDNIGMTPIDGVMTTPQQALEYLKGRVDASAPTLNIVSIKDFGAELDGVNDDTLAFQAAIDSISTTGGTVLITSGVSLITSTIYVHGNVNIVGNGNSTIKITAPISRYCSFAMGAKKDVPSGNWLWTGIVENITFDCGGDPNCGEIFAVFRADNCYIRNCTFIEPYHTSIKGVNNGAYANDYLRRTNLTYENNKVSVVTTIDPMGEGFSVNGVITNQTYPVKNIKFLNNVIEGIGDDPIAVHGECKDIIIANNICNTIDGRINVNDAKNVKIFNNLLTHSTDEGWYINSEQEIAGSARPENIEIYGNTIITPSIGGLNSGYGIRARGVKNCTIRDNVIINNLPDRTDLIAIEIDEEPQTGGHAEKTKIFNNYITNGIISMLSQFDLEYVIKGNIIDSGYIYLRDASGVCTSNTIKPQNTSSYIYNTSIGNITDVKLCQFVGTLPDSASYTLTLDNGLSTHYLSKPFQVTGCKISLSSLFSTGYTSMWVKVNGINKVTIGGDYTQQYYSIQSPTNLPIFTVGNLITVGGTTSTATGTNGIKIVVEIFGAYANI